MSYGISKYPYYHGVFGTDEYFEVYRYDECDTADAGKGIALFGSKEDADEYIRLKQAQEEGALV